MSEIIKDLPCEVVKDLLPLYHDGVVSSDTGIMIRAHLDHCEKCRTELDSICNGDKIEKGIIEYNEKSSFSAFRNGVSAIKRKGTIRGVLITALAVAVLLSGFIFLRTNSVIKVPVDQLKIDDVIRYDIGTDGGEGLFFTYEMDWDGGYAVIYNVSKDPKEIDIAIRRTAFWKKKFARHQRYCCVLNNFTKESADVKTAETIKVNGQVIWTKDQGVTNNPPDYVSALSQYEHPKEDASPEENTISVDIKTDSISAAFEDHHGVKWDKEGNVIATFTIDDYFDIVSIESVSDEN